MTLFYYKQILMYEFLGVEFKKQVKKLMTSSF